MIHFSRRQMLSYAAFSSAAVAGTSSSAHSSDSQPPSPEAVPEKKKYRMRKSINQWAFPYPEKMSLADCLLLAKAAGFDGIELNYDLDNDLSPKH